VPALRETTISLALRISVPYLQGDPFDKIMAKSPRVRRLTIVLWSCSHSDKRLQSISVERLDQAVVDYVMVPADRLKT